MRLVRIGRFVFNLDIKPDPLRETTSFVLKGEDAESYRRQRDALGVTPWRPRRAEAAPSRTPGRSRVGSEGFEDEA
jgi:hypothetical protein